MNLIEQLGGYENALGFYDESKEWSGVYHMGTLSKELLEHRRENNIFEKGDFVVSTLNGDEDWKNTVCEILGFHKKMAITTGFSCAIHHYEYRHATPQEIAQGYRDK